MNARSLILIAGDLVCFAVFAVLGLRNHDEGLTVSSFLLVVLPFAASWLVFAGRLGLLHGGPSMTPRSAWRGVLEAWLPAWMVGLGLRSLLFGRPFVLAFAIVALLFNGALLVAWRIGFAYVEGRRSSTRSREYRPR